MSNRTYLVQCTFVDKEDGEKHYGYRLFDDFEQVYYNGLSEEEYNRISPEDLLAHAIKHYPNFDLVPPKGIYVNDYYFRFDLETKKYTKEISEE